MANKVSKTFQMQVKTYREEPLLSGNGTRSVQDGWKQHEVEVTVDFDALLKQLGERAIRSKGGVARESKGSVVVKRIK